MSLPTPIAKQVERMAKSQRLSDNRILVELIELGIEARKQKEKGFLRACRTLSSRERFATSQTIGRRVGPSGFR